jgi:hypothetical protein
MSQQDPEYDDNYRAPASEREPDTTDAPHHDLPYKDDTSDGTTAPKAQEPENLGDDAGVDENGDDPDGD